MDDAHAQPEPYGALRLLVITGSVRPRRFGPVVASWFANLARDRNEFEVVELDLADYDLPLDLTANSDVERFRSEVDSADAFVFVTSEYNHGYPASLKNALDHLKYEWRGKPVGIVSYGGGAGGARATEQLRQVVAELHMVSVRDAVNLVFARNLFDEVGVLRDEIAPAAAARMLTSLMWWGNACRYARPYPRSH